MIRPSARVLLLLASVVVGAGVGVRPAHAQSAVDQAEAEIRQGTELRHQNQDGRALPHFERAYQLSRNPRSAAQLGLVKMALGYCVDAERLLDEALAVPDHPWISRNAGALLQTRANARRNIGEVSVTGSPAGAEIMVNGRPAGALPLAAPLRLDRGPVEIEVRAAGYASFTRSLKITAGARETLAVALVASSGGVARAVPPVATVPSTAAAAAAAPAAPSPAPVPPPPTAPAAVAAVPPPAPSHSPVAPAGPSPDVGAGPTTEPVPAPVPDTGDGATSVPLKPLALTAAGLATAGLVLGIVETVVAGHRADDFNNHTGASPTAADPNHRAPDCETAQLNDACRSIRDAHDRARTLAIVGYVGAGVFAVTSVVLFMRVTAGTGDATAGTVAARAGLTCAPTLVTAGVSCRVVF